jgi:hypothetical protein
MKKVFVLAIFLSLYFSGCTGNSSFYQPIDFTQPGDYYFGFMGADEKPVLEGILTVTEIKDSSLSGIYKITKVFDENFSGISVMRGIFSGDFSVNTNKVFLNFNPKVADNNVFVDFKVYKTLMLGKYYHSQSGTKISEGTFKSYKPNE